MEIMDYLPFILVVALFLYIYFKKRHHPRSAARQQEERLEGPIEGTLEELKASEDRLRSLPIDIREHLLETHTLYGRFSSRRGYSQEYMNDLTERLREEGIHSEVIFQHSLYPGAADSFLTPQGLFEFYVEREHLDRAKTIIEEFRRS